MSFARVEDHRAASTRPAARGRRANAYITWCDVIANAAAPTCSDHRCAYHCWVIVPVSGKTVSQLGRVQRAPHQRASANRLTNKTCNRLIYPGISEQYVCFLFSPRQALLDSRAAWTPCCRPFHSWTGRLQTESSKSMKVTAQASMCTRCYCCCRLERCSCHAPEAYILKHFHRCLLTSTPSPHS